MIKIYESNNEELVDESLNGLFTPLGLRKALDNLKDLKSVVAELSNLEVGDWYKLDNIDPKISNIRSFVSRFINNYDQFANNLR